MGDLVGPRTVMDIFERRNISCLCKRNVEHFMNSLRLLALKKWNVKKHKYIPRCNTVTSNDPIR